MKKTFFIIVLLLVVSSFGFWFFASDDTSRSNDLGSSGVRDSVNQGITREGLPPPSELDQPVYSLSKMDTQLRTGEKILVNNIKNSDTVDPDNREIFYFGNNRNNADRLYNLVYYDGYDAFEIQLLAQPLDEARTEAQIDLLDTLGVTVDTLCNLDLFVRTDMAPYQGDELGIDFCAGAVNL